MFETVTYRLDDAVATIALNRPERLNAINAALLRDLKAALDAANADEKVRAILLTGHGRAFCAGDDLKEFDEQAAERSATRAYVESIQNITRALVLNEKVVVGAVRGWAVGGGLEWTINCDFAVVAEDARFFFPETSLGVFVTGAVTALLPGMIGLQRARRLILLGERFTAGEAEALGFDWEIVPEPELDTRARALAERVAALPQGSVGRLKRALAMSPYGGLEAAMAFETSATVDGFLDPESSERARRTIAGERHG